MQKFSLIVFSEKQNKAKQRIAKQTLLSLWNIVIHKNKGHRFQTWKPIKPLTSGAFWQKCVSSTFWWFWGWISAKLALIWSKMHLKDGSLPFLPLASRFTTFCLGRAQKSKFWGFLIFEFFSPFLFLLLFSFCCSDWPSTGLARS